MIKRSIVLISILLTLVMLVACGGGGTPSGDTSTSDRTTSGGSSSTEGGVAAPERSRTVNFAYGARPLQLNPANYQQNSDQVAFQMYYESLIYTPHDGSGYRPMLAESWEIDPGQMFWIFKLRQGVTFHNGEPFDADDVVTSYEYLLSIKDTSPHYVAYWPNALSYVEKIDQYTVKIGFESPYVTAGNGFRCTYIFPNEAFEELGEELFRDTHSYGTGPWILQEWRDGQYSRFTKNENYWDKENFDSYFNEVYYRHMTEPSSTVAAHLAGDISVYAPLSGFDYDMLALYETASDRIEIITVPTHANDFIFFQHADHSPCKDINVRKAINHAIDRQLIYDTIYLGNGEGATDIWHRTMQGYNQDNAEYYKYDPELAKEYLAKSIYQGEALTLLCSNTGRASIVMQAIADMLAQVGINAVVRSEDPVTTTTLRNANEYDLSWGATNMPDRIPGRHINALYTNNDRHNLPLTEPFYDLCRLFVEELDVTKHDQLLRDIGSYSAANLSPHFVVGHPIAKFACDYGITGVDFYVDGFVNYAHIDYDPSLAR